MSDHQNWIELADLYALKSLRGEELDRFETHLDKGCSACEAHLSEVYNSLTLMPESLSSVVPPLSLKTQIMEQVALEPRLEGSSPSEAAPSFSMTPVYWAVGVAVITAALVTAVYLGNKPKEEVPVKKGQLVEKAIVVKEEPLNFPDQTIDAFNRTPLIDPQMPLQPQIRIEEPPVVVKDEEEDISNAFEEEEELGKLTSFFNEKTPEISSEVTHVTPVKSDYSDQKFEE